MGISMCQEMHPTVRIMIYSLTLSYETSTCHYITVGENKYNKHNSNPVTFFFCLHIAIRYVI